MARVDYNPVPNVEARIEAPDDTQHITASPEDFGAQVGEGLNALGEGAIKAQKFYGQVAATQATNNYVQQQKNILYGDPTKPALDDQGQPILGPDGAPVGQGGYYSLRGQAAMDARVGVEKQLSDAYAQQQKGLQTPLAQEQFQNDTKRLQLQEADKIGSFYNENYRTWTIDTQNTKATLALNTAAQQPANPITAGVAQEQVRSAYVKNAQLKGEDPAGAVLQADQHVALTRIQSLVGQGDPRAQQVLDESSGLLGSLSNYDTIVHAVKETVINSQFSPAVDKAVGDATATAQAAVSGGPPLPGVPGAAVPIAPPRGQVYNDIGSVAGQAGALPSEVSYLQRTAQLESRGDMTAKNGSHTGVFQFDAPSFARVGGTDITDLGQQTVAALTTARQNGARLTAAGVEDTGANRYIMHQQGPGGGLALLSAPADTNAIAALTPAYETAGRTPDQAAAIAKRAITGNGGTADMTAGQFTAMWQRKFGGAGGGGAEAGKWPSTSDAIVEAMPQTLANAQATAEKMWPNYPDVQDRYVTAVQRRLDQTVTQQHQTYEVDTHIVQAAMGGPNPPTSEQELIASSPQVAAAWTSVQVNNPYAAMGIEHMFDANAKGKAVTYGAEWKDYADRVLAGSKDPARITNPSQLWPFVGKGEDGALTNTGAGVLSDLLGQRGTPQGEAFAQQAKGFIDSAYSALTYADRSTGITDPKGEAAFGKYMAQALPILQNAAKEGKLQEVLDPKSPDYLGKLAQTFARTPAQMVRDRLTDEGEPDVLKGPLGPQEALKESVAAGRISRAEGVWIAQRMGYIQ